MTAPISGVDLLDFADDILGVPSPRPAALRRAVSAAYYAVFHELIGVAVRRAVGDDPTHESDRHAVSRWYSHHDVRVVSGWVIARARREKIPKLVEPFLDSPSPDLIALAKLVNELQDARVKADYVHTEAPTAERAQKLVGNARLALTHLAYLPGDRVSDNYLMFLLGGPRLPAR